jgi:hypothetical protein
MIYDNININKNNIVEPENTFKVNFIKGATVEVLGGKEGSYNIKFITAELTSIFYSEADNKTVFLLLKDSNIRSIVPFSTQNYYLN